MPPRTIAIDGPAGSGKSVIGKWLSDHLGYALLDTGVLYRAITHEALREGIAPSDGSALAALARRVDIDVRPGSVVLVGGHDVTERLFTPQVNEHVSTVAAHAELRAELLPLQRRIAESGRIVMIGRDVGTVVLPSAELKLYLDASVEERARRRWEQEHQRGGTRGLEEVMADVRNRDRLDVERATSPLRPADDAQTLDTDGMSLEDEKRRILEIVGSAGS